MAKRPVAFDLFAGAGGLALGVHDAGFRTEAVLERDGDACATLRKNARSGRAKKWDVLEADVYQTDFTVYEGRIDLLTAGVPCQPFSLGGKHRGSEDERNLFPEALRAVAAIKPRAVLFENVKGLLRESFRAYFEYILLRLEMPTMRPRKDEYWHEHKARLQTARSGKRRDLSYDVHARLLNAADFGVPQRRERVFIVAFRSDLEVAWTFPEPTHTKAALLVAQWYDGTYWDEHRIRPPKPPERNGAFLMDLMEGRKERWRTVRDGLRDLPEPSTGRDHPTVANHIANPGARPYKGHTGSPLDEPAKTLKAGVHGVPGGENTLQLPDGGVRYFTTREAARMQAFPDDYLFSGAWTETMRQIGNAVPVALAATLARQIRRRLR